MPVIVGVNDLKTKRPDLAKEWDYSKNVGISPDNISYGSHKEVYWICPKGHSYLKSVHSRSRGTGCHICSGVNFKRRNKLFDDYPELITELNTSVNTLEDLKNITCCSERKISWKCNVGHIYEQSAVVKIQSKGCPFCNNKRLLKGYNDLETWCENNNRMDLLKEWDYEKNDKKPSEIFYGSKNRCYFICSNCAHKWSALLYSRTLQKTSCVKCLKKKRTSFPEQSIFYYISKAFSDAVNGDRTILNGKELDIYIPSKKTAIEYDGQTWHKDNIKDIEKNKLCTEKGINLIRVRESKCEDIQSSDYYYEYLDWHKLNLIIKDILVKLDIDNIDINIERDELLIKNQFYKELKDNSLEVTHPEIAKEWHPTLNGDISPKHISSETHDSYYWLCPKCSNEYKAMVKNRVRMNSSCPTCGRENTRNKQMVKVKNKTTGEIFNSVSEAALKYNCQIGGIKACCRGITKTSQGYEWEYVDRELSSRKTNQNQKTQKRVLNIDTGEIYSSLKEAVLKTKIQNISACCRGVRNNAGGYRWKYID